MGYIVKITLTLRHVFYGLDSLQIGAFEVLLVLLVGGMQMTMEFEDMGCKWLICLFEYWFKMLRIM